MTTVCTLTRERRKDWFMVPYRIIITKQPLQDFFADLPEFHVFSIKDCRSGSIALFPTVKNELNKA